MHLWEQAKAVKIQTGPEIVGNFSLGFDKSIPEETKNALIDFVYWVEDNYPIPITLRADFKYTHYLVTRTKKRVGYKFYWVDFADYPVFTNPDDIPVIELPVRTEHSTIEEILSSFIEAISDYYLWLTNALTSDYTPDPDETEEVLQAYLQSKTK
jgi:hypothetical protein